MTTNWWVSLFAAFSCLLTATVLQDEQHIHSIEVIKHETSLKHLRP